MPPALRNALIAAAGTVLAVTGFHPASAESYHANCYSDNGGNICYGSPPATSGLDLAAVALYSDDTDGLCVSDMQKDGRSAVGVYWPDGRPGQKVRVWSHRGSGTALCASLADRRENARYRIQVCLGEWAPRPANRVIIACGPSKVVLL